MAKIFLFPQSILLFSQVLGILPMSVTKPPTSMMKFSLTVFIWQTIMFFFRCIVILVVFCYDVMSYVYKQPFLMSNTERMLTTLIRVIPLEIVGFVSLFSSKSNYSTLIEMCQILGRLDKTLGIKQKLGYRSSIHCLIMLIFLTIMNIVRVEKSIRMNIAGICYVPICLISYIQGDTFLQFIFLAKILTKRFKITNWKIRNVAMSTDVQKMKQVVYTLKGEFPELDEIKHLIEAYSDLYEAVEKANSFYSSHLLATILCSTFHMLTFLFTTITTWSKSSLYENMSQSLLAATYIAYLVALVLAGSFVQEEADITAPMVTQLLSADLDPKIKNELRTFSIQLLHYKVRFSALGFFELRRELLTAIASAATTYLVIMIQFKNHK